MKVGDLVKLDEEQFYEHEQLGLICDIVNCDDDGNPVLVEVIFIEEGEWLVLEPDELEILNGD